MHDIINGGNETGDGMTGEIGVEGVDLGRSIPAGQWSRTSHARVPKSISNWPVEPINHENGNGGKGGNGIVIGGNGIGIGGNGGNGHDVNGNGSGNGEEGGNETGDGMRCEIGLEGVGLGRSDPAG